MSTEKQLTPDEEADENPSQCEKEAQKLGVKMKTKLSQTYKSSNPERSTQKNEKDSEKAETLFKKAKHHTLEEGKYRSKDKLESAPSLDRSFQSTLEVDLPKQLTQTPPPSDQTDDNSLPQLLTTSGQSVFSSSKQSPYSSQRDSKSDNEQKDIESVKPHTSNLGDTTPSKSSSDEAYQKKLCEEILETDPLTSFEDSQIYFPKFHDDFSKKLEMSDPEGNIKKEFSKIDNDYDRIKYILQFEKHMNLKFNIAKHNSKSEKFASASEREFKNYCNAQADNLNHGLKLINRSIQFTPGEDRKRLGIRLMKRAWINIIMLKFDEAREDAHRSLQYHFDPSVMWNSFEVLGHCYAKLGKNNTAEGFFSQALDRLKQSNLDQKRKTVTETRINFIFKRIKGRKDIGGPFKNFTEVLTTPQVSYGVNKSLTCATDAVEAKINSKYDRGLYATKNIDPGDVIIVEKPYVSALSMENFETHCINCFKRFKSPIPCETCSRVWFCNKECLQEAKGGFHSSECKVLHLLYESEMCKVTPAPLVFRILLLVTWEKIKTIRKSMKIETKLPDNHPLHKMFNFPEKYSSDDYRTIFKLVTNAHKRGSDNIFHLTIMAVYLNQCLKETDFFKGDNVSSEDEIYVASLILRHIQNSICNTDNIIEFIVKENSSDITSYHTFGWGIYPTSSLINHSCNPNVFKYNVGKDQIVRAASIIRNGEQLFCNYTHVFDIQKKKFRRQTLENQFMFHCECKACEENWPISEENNVFMKLPCPVKQCDQMVIYDGMKTMICRSCSYNKKQHKRLLKEVKNKIKVFEDSFQLLKRGDEKEAAITAIKNFQIYSNKNFIPPARCLKDIQEMFRESFYCIDLKIFKN